MFWTNNTLSQYKNTLSQYKNGLTFLTNKNNTQLNAAMQNGMMFQHEQHGVYNTGINPDFQINTVNMNNLLFLLNMPHDKKTLHFAYVKNKGADKPVYQHFCC